MSRSLRSALAAVGVGVVMVLLAPTSATAAPGDGSYPGGTGVDTASFTAGGQTLTGPVYRGDIQVG